VAGEPLMAGTDAIVEEPPLDELPVDEFPVEEAPLDENGELSPPQPATITAPSNPTTINRCIVQSPLVSSDLENKAARTRSKRGDSTTVRAERHSRQPRYLSLRAR